MVITKKVSTSANGTASQIPGTLNSKGSPRRQITMNTNPRNTVTTIAGRARYTL